MDYRVINGTLFVGQERFIAGTSSDRIPSDTAKRIDTDSLLRDGTIEKWPSKRKANSNQSVHSTDSSDNEDQ